MNTQNPGYAPANNAENNNAAPQTPYAYAQVASQPKPVYCGAPNVPQNAAAPQQPVYCGAPNVSQDAAAPQQPAYCGAPNAKKEEEEEKVEKAEE